MLKLLASRTKDYGDIQTLCRKLRIRKRAQLETMLRKYVAAHQLDAQVVEDYREEINKTLEKLFPA